MKRVLIDTNVYEFILKQINRPLLETIAAQKQVLFYGNAIIRKELRDIPQFKTEIVEGQRKSLRITLLQLYDFMVLEHHYQITTQMEELADKYFIVYKTLGGNKTKKELRNDFIIVACASLHDLDIIVSEDSATMLLDTCVKSYAAVNQLLGFRTPQFMRFKEFKKALGGVTLD